jgi:alginate O-acetyltransferase complex protein AlgJ
MKESRVQSFSEALTTILFIGLLFAPLLGGFWNFDFYPHEGENRTLAQFPDLGQMPLDQLPDALSDYTNDHFGFRNTFIHGYNNFYADVLGMKKGRVSKGLDDWLFFDENIKDFMGFRRFSDEQLTQITNSITKRDQWTKAQEIPFIMAIPPDKINVHGEMLPDVVPSADALTRWKQVKNNLPPLEELNIIDLKDHLVKAKTELGPLYYRNDTHWNFEGSYAAYRVILSSLKQWFPDLEPVSLDQFDYLPSENVGDLPPLMGKSNDYVQMYHKLTPKNFDLITTEVYPFSEARPWHTWPKNALPSLRTNPEQTGRILVFGDSFGYHLLTYLPQHFNQTAFFQMYASKANMTALIEEFQPDVILEIHLERMIDKFIETSYYLD